MEQIVKNPNAECAYKVVKIFESQKNKRGNIVYRVKLLDLRSKQISDIELLGPPIGIKKGDIVERFAPVYF